jgi:cleavage and polyadenylation specificity factor subunit 3
MSVTSNRHPHSHSHSHSHTHAVTNGENGDNSSEDFERLRRFLTAHFGEVSMPSDGDDDSLLVIDIKVDNLEARVDLITMVSKSKW